MLKYHHDKYLFGLTREEFETSKNHLIELIEPAVTVE
jgi:hypothetical protein